MICVLFVSTPFSLASVLVFFALIYCTRWFFSLGRCFVGCLRWSGGGGMQNYNIKATLSG